MVLSSLSLAVLAWGEGWAEKEDGEMPPASKDSGKELKRHNEDRRHLRGTEGRFQDIHLTHGWPHWAPGHRKWGLRGAPSPLLGAVLSKGSITQEAAWHRGRPGVHPTLCCSLQPGVSLRQPFLTWRSPDGLGLQIPAFPKPACSPRKHQLGKRCSEGSKRVPLPAIFWLVI